MTSSTVNAAGRARTGSWASEFEFDTDRPIHKAANAAIPTQQIHGCNSLMFRD